MPHTDFSVDGAILRLKEIFASNGQVYAGRKFDFLKYENPAPITSTPCMHNRYLRGLR